jgi:DNA-directed RNA polymerase subunit E'/Rpb7
MDCFLPIRFRTTIQLSPSELNTDFQAAISNKLRTNLEGLCTRFGYIKPNSIEIVRRSAGQFVKQHFNGHIRFEMVCKAEVCNPPQGLVVKAYVKVKNEMGVLAESSIDMDGTLVPVLDIIVPLRAAGISSEIDLEEVQTGEEIYVSVLSKRYQLRDKKISVIGRAVRKPSEVMLEEQQVTALEGGNRIEDVADRISQGSFDDETDSSVIEVETEDELDGSETDDEFSTKVTHGGKKVVTFVEGVEGVEGAEEKEPEEEEEFEDDFYEEDPEDPDDPEEDIDPEE